MIQRGMVPFRQGIRSMEVVTKSSWNVDGGETGFMVVGGTDSWYSDSG